MAILGGRDGGNLSDLTNSTDLSSIIEISTFNPNSTAPAEENRDDLGFSKFQNLHYFTIFLLVLKFFQILELALGLYWL